ncbi:hypothetical protein FisN_26Hu026 [Fistulifera solaris]|uniref:Fucolectin tachylectin-4 pentraxin-1 domain-containing protein n=1 Tax=Fistulifera solaris TaxID=1519565 RepID=A0A1Z5JXX7_FISSO|nr:hypothetical protein FisN_26Hu026 [Fistulifera solaris]|eukprot:GAX18736.1 hypothetical protein FisN_26Hu026 [Fistulifera solaris]
MKFSCSIIALVTFLTNLFTITMANEVTVASEKQILVAHDKNRSLRGLRGELSYQGRICSSESEGVFRCNTANTQCQPDQWDYWLLHLEGNTTYTIEVDRISCNLDPALFVSEGFGTRLPTACYFNAFSPELGLIGFANDNDPKPAFCLGLVPSPFDDPKFVVVPHASGPFTLGVVNYASDPLSCRVATGFRYKIKISPRPSCA